MESTWFAMESRATLRGKRSLRCGFSTGTASTAAAMAALRQLLTGKAPSVVAVRLPVGYFIAVHVRASQLERNGARATVIKDAGDDPDVTDGAELRATVKCGFVWEKRAGICTSQRIRDDESGDRFAGIDLLAGAGVGIVTKPGLPVKIGEPAINPTPREMLAQNLTEELLRWDVSGLQGPGRVEAWQPLTQPRVHLPFSQMNDRLANIALEVEIEVPRGEELARHTLNPRLGILGGISILGTTGIVKPFSHKAYEETIHTALSVAASSGCKEVVLSTGGRSERFARSILTGWPAEAFVQIADFFAFAVREAREFGFEGIVHSAFWGKVIKMAQGHAYTHAHEVPLDLNPVALVAGRKGYDPAFCLKLADANTARHALELLLAHNAGDIIHAVASQALQQSERIAQEMLTVRLLLFDYDGTLLADLEKQCTRT